MLGSQARTTEGPADCPPTPEREINAGEFVALLATVTLPVKVPFATGLNVASRVADCPGARINPSETPLIVYCPPEIVTFDTVTLEFPVFVRTTVNPLVFPIATLPKLKLDVLIDRNGPLEVCWPGEMLDPPAVPVQPDRVKITKSIKNRTGNEIEFFARKFARVAPRFDALANSPFLTKLIIALDCGLWNEVGLLSLRTFKGQGNTPAPAILYYGAPGWCADYPSGPRNRIPPMPIPI